VDEIPEGEPITAGKFPVNQNPAVVLFDSGSSHSFMSQAFAQKHEQFINLIRYVVYVFIDLCNLLIMSSLSFDGYI
jgi:hypothetical protein